MKDTISRSALLKEANAEENVSGKDWDYDALKCAIELAPALDVEYVIRCKDCAKRKTLKCPMCKEETDIDFHSRYTYIVDKTVDDGYCNFGINKTSL